MTPSIPVPILLVDDQPANLIALEALLQQDDVIVLKAQSGAEALELLLQHDVALALLDVQMPEINGFELAEFMRGSERTRHVPIIFVTAGSADVQRQFRGYEAGAVDFIQKPIEAHILETKVKVFYDLYRQRCQIAAQRDALAASTEALKEADRSKDQFLAILAHELRNPVAALMGGVELLGRRKEPEKVLEIREGMARMLYHLSRMVEDLVDVSRINHGKVSLNPTRINLKDVVISGIGGSRHNIEAAGHALIVDIPDEPVWLEADYTRISQILGNLLNNAARYTPKGGEIRIVAQEIMHENQPFVEIRVSDNGVGISQAIQGKIFNFFIQGEDHGSQARGGLGIGLALVKQFTDLHHGTITVESAGVGQGSTFTLRIPVKFVKK